MPRYYLTPAGGGVVIDSVEAPDDDEAVAWAAAVVASRPATAPLKVFREGVGTVGFVTDHGAYVWRLKAPG